MKISFWAIGKPHEPFVSAGVLDFTKRISNYFTVSWQVFPPLKNAAALPETELKRKEADVILKALHPDDFLVALDERGKQVTSVQLAALLESWSTRKHIIFLIGGAFGLDESIMKRAGLSWSLSTLTFPHQLVRLILAEQVYRACTILRNEKYHHK